jgi:hypothetical protein
MRTFFKNRPPWLYRRSIIVLYRWVVGGIAVDPPATINHGGRFLKNVLIFEKREGADAFENDPPFRSKGTVGSSYGF